MICWAWAKNSVPRIGHRQVDQYGGNRYMLSVSMGKEISTISYRTHGQVDQCYILYRENRDMLSVGMGKEISTISYRTHGQVDQCYILYRENRDMLSVGMGKEISTISYRTHGQVDQCYDYCARGKGIDALIIIF